MCKDKLKGVRDTSFDTTAKIMGEQWSVVFRKESEDVAINDNCKAGYCDKTSKRIAIRAGYDTGPSTLDNFLSYQDETIRHEIVHAFLFESGFDHNTDWAINETVIAWIANKLPYIVEVIDSLGAMGIVRH